VTVYGQFTLHRTVNVPFRKFEFRPPCHDNFKPFRFLGDIANTEAAMERLHFACPKTGQDVDVGIDSDIDTLLRIRSNHVLAKCARCGERHEWEIAEARLLQAA